MGLRRGLNILSTNVRAVAPVIPDVEDYPHTPLLNVNEVSCNCSNFPATDKVMLSALEDVPNEQHLGENDTASEHWFSDESEADRKIDFCMKYS